MQLRRGRLSRIPVSIKSNMHSGTQFSALSSWVLLISRAIESYGYDSLDLFAKVGLDHARLRDPAARFSYPAVTRLWALSAATSRDPCFGLTVASFWHPTTLHALGYSFLASNNLEEAYERSSRYSRIINTAANGVLKIKQTADSYGLIIDPGAVKPHPESVALDAALGMLLVMSRAAYGAGFHSLRVCLQRDKPDDANRFGEFFSAPVTFSQPENAMWLESAMVQEALTSANPELVRVNDQVVTDYLARLDRGDISMRVRSKLIEHLPSGKFNEGEIASAINVSKRSLQRKLGEQGMSFTQLLEETRRDLSRDYVRDPQHSFNEIAFLLGFAEPGNFSRAFKRWYGKSPSQYRLEANA